jgi:hypothetical protein
MWTRVSKRFSSAALVAALSAGCVTHSVAPVPVPASSAPRVEATFLESEPARPGAVAQTEAPGVATLREPVGPRAIAHFVETFLDAWRSESPEALDALLSQSSDTGPIEATGRGREAILENWRQRLKAHPHEYSRLEGELVDPVSIEHWDADDVNRLGSSLPHVPARTGDVYVSAPLRTTTQSGSERLFGNYLVMVLRREKGELHVVAYGETADRPSR